ncbi:MAG: hypothetical protein ACREER_00370 [Alphaproteobacteria bacterium]
MLRTVRLELARIREFPEGSAERGYEFVAPLTADGHIDAADFPASRAACTVRRFWRGEDDTYGRLIHTRHRTWAFSYAPGEDDDEPFHHLETHRLVEGEYVSVREHDGVTRTFRVARIR